MRGVKHLAGLIVPMLAMAWSNNWLKELDSRKSGKMRIGALVFTAFWGKEIGFSSDASSELCGSYSFSLLLFRVM